MGLRESSDSQIQIHRSGQTFREGETSGNYRVVCKTRNMEWNGPVEWTRGMDSWNGLMEWLGYNNKKKLFLL